METNNAIAITRRIQNKKNIKNEKQNKKMQKHNPNIPDQLLDYMALWDGRLEQCSNHIKVVTRDALFFVLASRSFFGHGQTEYGKAYEATPQHTTTKLYCEPQNRDVNLRWTRDLQHIPADNYISCKGMPKPEANRNKQIHKKPTNSMRNLGAYILIQMDR